MKFADQKILQDRFTSAAETLDRYVSSLAEDIAKNPKMTAEEIQFNVAGSLAQGLPVSVLLDLVSVAVYRQALVPSVLSDEYELRDGADNVVARYTIPCAERELPYVPPSDSAPCGAGCSDPDFEGIGPLLEDDQ